MDNTNVLYYESHVTIEPCFGEKLEKLKHIAAQWGYRVANLVMLGKNEPNQKDSFLSARDQDRHRLEGAMNDFVAQLMRDGFKVYRYKLEATLLDVRCVDGKLLKRCRE